MNCVTLSKASCLFSSSANGQSLSKLVLSSSNLLLSTSLSTLRKKFTINYMRTSFLFQNAKNNSNKLYLTFNQQLSSRTSPTYFRFRRSEIKSLKEQLLANNSKQINNSQHRQNNNSQGPNPANNSTKGEAGNLSIFKRFKEAYKQHGKILIWCHVVTCCGWIVAFYCLARSGFDIFYVFNALEKLHIMSNETSKKIEKKIETFNLEKFLRSYYFDYVLSDESIKWLSKSITGITLKHMLTAVMLYKIFTPVRYLATLTVTNVIIKLFKKRGLMPTHPPAGSSIPELIKEQQAVVEQNIRRQREAYRLYQIKMKQQNRFTLFKRPRPPRNNGSKN